MKHVYKIDSIRLKLKPVDLDGDGIVDEVESVTRKRFDEGVSEIKESTELKDAIQEFNKDEQNKDGLSSIDFMGNVQNMSEMPSLIALDSSVGLRVIPSRSAIIGRISMRKNVAYQMGGRKQFVELITGKQNADRLSAAQKVINYSGMGSSK